MLQLACASSMLSLWAVGEAMRFCGRTRWAPGAALPPPLPPREFREVAARPRGGPSGDFANSLGGRGALVGCDKMPQCHSSINEQ